jgi:hypothetical protein
MKVLQYTLRINKQRIPNSVLNKKSKMKTPKSETEIKMRTTGYKRCHAEEKEEHGKKVRKRKSCG